MHLPDSLTIPHWRPTLRHAIPNVLEGKLIPAVIFVAFLELFGTRSAILAALGFALAAMLGRVIRKREIPGLLWLTTIGLVARTIAALATGSVVIYFLQPTVATAMFGLAFLVSVMVKKPMVERLLLDVCPLDDSTRKHPQLQRFFTHVSLWWAFTSMVNFSITLWLLLSQSPTTFVVVKSFMGPVTTSVTFAVAFVWFRALMSRTGTSVVFADRHAPVPVRVAAA